MKKSEVVEFVKTHKKEIAIAVGLTVVGIAYVHMCVKFDAEHEAVGSKIQEALRKAEEAEKNGGVHDIFKETLANGETCISAIIGDMVPADLGKLGEEMMAFDGVSHDTKANVIVSCRNQK